MRRIDGDYVDFVSDEFFNPFHRVVRDADRRSRKQSAARVLCGVGILNGFFDVFDGDKPFQIEIGVDDGQFSMRCSPRISFASSSVVPTGAVTRFFHVIILPMGWL